MGKEVKIMNKLRKIRTVAFLLAFVFVLGMVGCGNGSEKDANGESVEASSTEIISEETSSTESEDDSAMYEGKTKIRVMSYNIRCLRGGESGAGYDPLSESQMNKTKADFAALLEREDPDIFIVCENRMYFDAPATSAEGGKKNVYDFFFKEYFRYGYNLESGASLPRIYSKYKLYDMEYIDVAYAPGVGGGRRPLSVKVKVGGEEICVIACHPEAGPEVYETSRKPYFEAIINYCKDKEKVIIGGDLNTDTADFKAELDGFKDDFTLGNFGEFGTFRTYRYGKEEEQYLDNILVKGLKMRNFRVGTDELSDHFPIFSEIYIME